MHIHIYTHIHIHTRTYTDTYIHTRTHTHPHTHIHTYTDTYIHKFHIIENPKCSCDKGQQTVDHIIYSCNLHEEERNRLKAVITRSEQWPVSENKLVLKYYKDFKQFTDNIVFNKE